MQLPSTAPEFVRFMTEVWKDTPTPLPDGGIRFEFSDLYDRYHHALRTVQECGAKRTGTTKLNGEDAGVFQFDDGSRVTVVNRGSACVENYRKPHTSRKAR